MNIYLDLFLTFFKIGAFTFGGGYAMLPFVQQEVIAHRWMTMTELVDFIAVSESTPGPFAVNVATYVGTHTAGFFGAFCATVGVILPSFLIILLIAHAYEKFKNSAAVRSVMTGLKPAVVGLIGAAVLTVAISVFEPGAGGVGSAAGSAAAMAAYDTGQAAASGISASRTILSILLFAFSTFMVLKKKTHPIKVIVIAAAAGTVCGYLGLL